MLLSPRMKKKMLDRVMRHIKESTSFAFLAFHMTNASGCILVHRRHIFSHERLSSSLVLYVIPLKRGSHAAAYLMDMFR